MYRSRCVLGKQTNSIFLSSRSHNFVTSRQTRRLLERSRNVKNKASNGQLMSTVSKGSYKNRLLPVVAGGILFLGGITLVSKYNTTFRKTIEDTIPFSEHVFRYVLPPPTPEAPGGATSPDDFVVINVMDLPAPSQIDFEVGKGHATVKEECETEEEIHVHEQIPPVEKVHDESSIFLNMMDVPSPSQIDFIVGKKDDIVGSDDLLPATPQTEEVQEAKHEEQSQSQILNTAYENLKIILDDTITTKTSAAGMLHGYITQFGQALLIPKEDLAYESIWDANSVLEHSIQESIDLVRTKETEVNSQVKNIEELINDIRKYGISDIADKAEELIISCNESLHWVESEVGLLTNKLNVLLEFQRQLDESPEKLQKYLHDFIPDLIKLLNLKQLDVQNLSKEDALLMTSLRRPELMYREMQEKETEQNLQFETTLQKQEDNVRKEASEHLSNIVEKLETDKNNEINEKVKEIEQLHENHLQEQLKIQYEAHQQELHDTKSKQELEWAAQYKTELEAMLNKQEDRHYDEVLNNLSYLRGIESKVADVLDIDEKLRRNQHLWPAVHALNIALNDILENGRTKQLIPEISDILQCNDNDDILSTIVSGVPESAASSGVIPEHALMQRFNDIKCECKRTAMLRDEGNTVFSYVLSYIKSIVVISQFYQRHIADEVDLETLGPYEILEKADYYIQQGDLEQAAKFMSQLKGVPRKLCADWLKEVRLLLETKQSVNLLMAYAVGSLIA